VITQVTINLKSLLMTVKSTFKRFTISYFVGLIS